MAITLDEAKTQYPDGLHCPEHGCFYFMDYDNELAYLIEYRDGTFDADVNYVDFDTLDDDVRKTINEALTTFH